jgi:hypothetical protein
MVTAKLTGLRHFQSGVGSLDVLYVECFKSATVEDVPVMTMLRLLNMYDHGRAARWTRDCARLESLPQTSLQARSEAKTLNCHRPDIRGDSHGFG